MRNNPLDVSHTQPADVRLLSGIEVDLQDLAVSVGCLALYPVNNQGPESGDARGSLSWTDQRRPDVKLPPFFVALDVDSMLYDNTHILPTLGL